MFGDVTFAQAPFAALGGNTFSAAIDEASTASDSSFQVSTKGGFQEETSAASHLQSVLANMVASQQESVSGADAVSNFGNILKAVVAEMASAATTQSAIANMLASQSEGAQGQATTSSIATLYASISEQAAGSDVVLGLAVFPVAISEGASGQDQINRVAVRAATIAEYAGASAVLTPLREANVYPSGVQLLINIGGVLVWAVIDDTQNPDWQNIVNAQGSGWTVLATSQSPAWQAVDTPQNAGWTDVPDAQSPGWTNLSS